MMTNHYLKACGYASPLWASLSAGASGKIIDAERELDQVFANGTISVDELRDQMDFLARPRVKTPIRRSL
jgi:hypothetical protein